MIQSIPFLYIQSNVEMTYHTRMIESFSNANARMIHMVHSMCNSNSASVEDNATVDCFFVFQVMAPPLNVKRYPDVDREVSLSPP